MVVPLERAEDATWAANALKKGNFLFDLENGR
jgi:hypothetical protein